jgi:hypothetical protein
MPTTLARQWIDLSMKNSSVIEQHSKTMAGDHGLNRDGDAIVIWLRGTAEQRPDASQAGRSVAAHAYPVKMSSCAD